MEAVVKIYKTLPHLQQYLLNHHRCSIYATSLSIPIWRYLANVNQITPGKESTVLTDILHQEPWVKVKTITGKYEYQILGETLALWPPGYEYPIRIRLDYDQISEIQLFQSETGMTIKKLEKLMVSSFPLTDSDISSMHIVLESLGDERIVFTTQIPSMLVNTKYTNSLTETDFTFPQLFWGRYDLLALELERWLAQGYSVKILSKHSAEIPAQLWKLQTPHRQWELLPDALAAGFVSESQKLVVLTDREIFGTIFLSTANTTHNNASKLLAQIDSEISVGDYVVHEVYGIAIYSGLTQETVSGVTNAYLNLQFAGDDQLLLPVSQVSKLSRFIGHKQPRLSQLGRQEWQRTKQKITKSVKTLARQLLAHHALRKVSTAVAIANQDSPAYHQFVSRFPYPLTTDQERSVNEILFDMSKQTPMDRLLVGDVGFGKTEVIMRAVFKTVEAGFQAFVLCPTTVLSTQHFAVFQERFHNTGVQIAQLSRTNQPSENRQIREQVTAGKIDVVIGTHALLHITSKLPKLGLIVVDEEQKFGVAQKEKLRAISFASHHLSVSATPIPRTLGLALSTVQDISIISTPPIGRKPIITKLAPFSWNDVVKRIIFELERDGQVYFVHNRVEDIESIHAQLSQVIPSAKITVAHGQLSPAELEKRMTNFFTRKSDVLLCTTIIENGLDMPNVNTLIVHQAERFGLAQLYQLRGRVGRSPKQAYCYLFHSVPTELTEPEKIHTLNYLPRLEALVSSTELGAGFGVASRDLELRGAGNILGEEQHGHISEIGYSLYMRLLAEEMEAARNQEKNYAFNL